MTQLRSLLLAIAVVAAWGLVVTSTPAIHRAIFAIVAPDGPVSAADRVAIDRVVTAFVRSLPPLGDADLPVLATLSAKELSHLEDVMGIVGTVWLLVLPGTLVGLALTRFSLTEPLAVTWSIGLVGLIGLISLTMFGPLFVGLHPILFPAGNWQLPSDQYLLTQVYPLGFFVVAWVLILAFSLLTLAVLRKKR